MQSSTLGCTELGGSSRGCLIFLLATEWPHSIFLIQRPRANTSAIAARLHHRQPMTFVVVVRGTSWDRACCEVRVGATYNCWRAQTYLILPDVLWTCFLGNMFKFTCQGNHDHDDSSRAGHSGVFFRVLTRHSGHVTSLATNSGMALWAVLTFTATRSRVSRVYHYLPETPPRRARCMSPGKFFYINGDVLSW